MTPSAAVRGTMDDDAGRLRVLDAVRAAGGQVTLADVVARTGIRGDVAEATLGRLVTDYESDLDVAEDGTLVYRFDPAMKARPDVVAQERRRRRRQALGRWARRAFKAWTVAMVIVYTVVFVVLILAVALRGGGEFRMEGSRRRRRSTGSRVGEGLVRGFLWGLFYNGDYWLSRRRARRRAQEIEARIRAGADPYSLAAEPPKQPKPSLIDRTWFFLFGTRGLERTPLGLEKELVTYVRAKRGLITNADIMAVAGVSYAEADTIGTRLVASYGGELDLTDDATAVYRFPNLMVSASPELAKEPPKLDYVWGVRAREEALRQAPSKVIPALNAFNLFGSVLAVTRLMPALGLYGLGWTVALFVVPFTYSVLFFAIAGVRVIRDTREAPRRRRADMRLAVMRLLFARGRSVVLPVDAARLGGAGLGTWSAEELIQAAPALAEELGGEVRPRRGGSVELDAPRARGELALVERLRARASAVQPVGRTVFSTTQSDYSVPLSEDPLAQEIGALEGDSPP